MLTKYIETNYKGIKIIALVKFYEFVMEGV